MKKNLLVVTLVMLITTVFSSFKVNEKSHIPKEGENILTYASLKVLAKSYQEAMNEKNVIAAVKTATEELKKRGKVSWCIALWSDEYTFCNIKKGTQDKIKHTSLCSVNTNFNFTASCSRYLIIYDCNSYDIIYVDQIL